MTPTPTHLLHLGQEVLPWDLAVHLERLLVLLAHRLARGSVVRSALCALRVGSESTRGAHRDIDFVLRVGGRVSGVQRIKRGAVRLITRCGVRDP
jgi:hypothetical protein